MVSVSVIIVDDDIAGADLQWANTRDVKKIDNCIDTPNTQ